MIQLKDLRHPVFYFSHLTYAPASNELFLGCLKLVQSNEQSTILTLTFETENIELGKNFLNSLMDVYDSLNIEDKNKISNQ